MIFVAWIIYAAVVITKKDVFYGAVFIWVLCAIDNYNRLTLVVFCVAGVHAALLMLIAILELKKYRARE